MVEAARRHGLRYLAVTDHSRSIPSPTHGTGMDETALPRPHRSHPQAAQERLEDFTLLAGIEVDILPDGRLDMDDEVLAQLDLVVGSLHSRLNMEAAEMTDRVLRALENPRLHVWGHPLARIILKREPVAVDMARGPGRGRPAGRGPRDQRPARPPRPPRHVGADRPARRAPGS